MDAIWIYFLIIILIYAFMGAATFLLMVADERKERKYEPATNSPLLHLLELFFGIFGSLFYQFTRCWRRKSSCFKLTTTIILIIHLIPWSTSGYFLYRSHKLAEFQAKIEHLRSVHKCTNLNSTTLHLVRIVQENFRRKVDQSEFHENELNTFLSDCLVQRYLIKNLLDVNGTVSGIERTLRWRKKEKVAIMRDDYLPEVFKKYGVIYAIGHDYKDRQLVYFRIKYFCPKHEIYRRSLVTYIYHILFKADHLAASMDKEYRTVNDFTGATLSNVDYKLPVIFIETVKKHFATKSSAILHNFPYYMRPFIYFLRTLVSAHTFSSADGDEIFEQIPVEQLPPYMGGSNANFTTSPGIYVSNEEYFGKTYNMTPAEVRDMITTLEQFFGF